MELTDLGRLAPRIFLSLSEGTDVHAPCFYFSVGDPNPGLHACTAGILLMKVSSQLLDHGFVVVPFPKTGFLCAA